MIENPIPVGYMDRRAEGTSVLRQAQLVQLHLLHVLDEICRRHDIGYWLAWGSCLGALRHGGFIPWDDDLDVGMFAADYRRLLKILPSELPDDVRLQRPEDCPRVAIPFAKIRDVNSFCGEVRPDVSIADPSGLYIDLFPFEDVPMVGRPFARFLIHAAGSSWHRSKQFLNRASLSVVSAIWSVPVAIAFRALNLLVSVLVWILRKTLPCPLVSAMFNHGSDYLYPRSWFETTRLQKFEDGEFPVPAEAEKYLSVRYGAWQKIPPPEDRPRHAVLIDPFHSIDNYGGEGD